MTIQPSLFKQERKSIGLAKGLGRDLIVSGAAGSRSSSKFLSSYRSIFSLGLILHPSEVNLSTWSVDQLSLLSLCNSSLPIFFHLFLFSQPVNQLIIF
jgi:heptaprenylglyceryl phosphate synthase